MNEEKFIWVQHGGGDFECFGKTVEFECVFKPQKIRPKEKVPTEISTSIELLHYVPDDITIDSGGGGFILEFTDNIEVVRKEWYTSLMNHYNHLNKLSNGQIVVLGNSWHEAIKGIVAEAESHRETYPELWI